MALRFRIVTGLAALVLAALAALAVGTAVAVRHNLLSRLDSQLATASSNLATPSPADRGGATDSGASGGAGPSNTADQPGRGGRPPDSAPPAQTAQVRAAVGPDDYVEYLAPGGSVLTSVTPTVANGADRPVTDPTAGDAGTRVVTGPGANGAAERVAITTLADGSRVVVAAPLGPIDAAVRHLIEVEVGVGAVVLVATLALGILLARQLTRPLERIATTADAIARGDIDRRVDEGTGRSEVQRVAVALNSMLASITAAFARRDVTEARLRRFVTDASHELATPLTSIRGYAELFDRGLVDRPADLRVAMNRIEGEARRMSGLVEELLLLARLDAAEGPAGPRSAGGPEPIDLARIAADTAADLWAADHLRPIRLAVDGPVVVLGDDDRLRQVAANLASNARRHTPPGTAVTIAARAEDERAVLEVSDEGTGLAPADAARVFERFYRVDRARSRRAGGTGLGLSIVASIAEAHGGRATVSSSPGSGATFTVTLPLFAGAAAPDGIGSR